MFWIHAFEKSRKGGVDSHIIHTHPWIRHLKLPTKIFMIIETPY